MWEQTKKKLFRCRPPRDTRLTNLKSKVKAGRKSRCTAQTLLTRNHCHGQFSFCLSLVEVLTISFYFQSTNCRRRLIRDFKRLSSDPPGGISGSPCPDNIMLWNAVIFGPGAYP